MAAAAKTTSPTPRKSTDSQGRRRSSSGMFGGMQDYKRDSAAHTARRDSIKEQTGSGGFLVNMFNSTFKGDKE